MASAPENDQRRYYENLRINDAQNPALKYGQALAEMKPATRQRQSPCSSRWSLRSRSCRCCISALAQAQFAAGQPDKAVATFEHGLTLSPRNVPLSVRYAETLLKLGNAKKAHMLLLDLFNNVPPTPEQIKLIALAASSAGDTGDAYYYMGELSISNAT